MNEIVLYDGNQIEPAEAKAGKDFNKWFAEFLDYLDRSPNTTRAYIINFRQFAKYMQANNITRPTRETIISYREYLIGKGYKASTITGYLHSVRQFFAWTASNEYYDNIADNIHAPKVDSSELKKDCFTPSEVITIEESIDNKAQAKTAAAAEAYKDKAGRVQRSKEQGLRLQAMYQLAVNAGLRTIEISRANVKDLEELRGVYYLYIWGKGRSEPDQKLALAPEVAQAINDYLAARSDNFTGSSPLFVATGNRNKGGRIASTTISTMLKKAMKEAGFNSDRLTAHSLRHTAGTSVMEITGDIYQTQNYMRHSDPATTERYLHNDKEKQQVQTAARLYDYYHGKEDTDPGKLESIIQGMTPAQVEQLTGIALAMVS